MSLKEKQSEQTRFDKVNVVSNYINEHLDVGDIDSPKTYFKAAIPMRWVTEPPGYGNGFVYFGGKTQDTIFGLGGSVEHVIGEEKARGLSTSFTVQIFRELEKFEPDLPRFSGDQTRGNDTTKDKGRDYFLDLIATMTKQHLDGPEERLEFLAKRLVEGDLANWTIKKHVLLGSPIYVAYAD